MFYYICLKTTKGAIKIKFKKTKNEKILAIILVGLLKQTSAQLCFEPAINYPIASTPTCIYSNDFNLDGNKDLAISNNSTNNVSILLGTGTGTFGSATNITFTNSPSEIIGGDFNGDAKVDLAIAGGVDNVWILLGTGTGTFSSPTSFTGGDYPT